MLPHENVLPPQRIGLVGLAGHGKTTVARELVRWNYQLQPFAFTLKRMLLVLGLPHENLWGNKKEEPLDLLGGKSAREVMQTLGTEWGRNLVDSNLWVRAWEHRVQSSRVVADDVRFNNEISAIRGAGGVIIHVTRPGHMGTSQPLHISETELRHELVSDYQIVNTGTLIDIAERVDASMLTIMKDRANASSGSVSAAE